jgi:hypothetical protein
VTKGCLQLEYHIYFRARFWTNSNEYSIRMAVIHWNMQMMCLLSSKFLDTLRASSGDFEHGATVLIDLNYL